jgi:hypothetical protein
MSGIELKHMANLECRDWSAIMSRKKIGTNSLILASSCLTNGYKLVPGGPIRTIRTSQPAGQSLDCGKESPLRSFFLSGRTILYLHAYDGLTIYCY